MRIACLLLAAGAGSRFGSAKQCKQLALIDGKPLVKRSLETLACVFAENIYIVLGAYAKDIRPVVADLAQVIDHEEWKMGIGSSIAYGVKRIEAQGEYDGILIALADQLQLIEDDFHKLINQFDGKRTVAAYYSDSLGVPAIFPLTQFENLKRLGGDRGAKSILMAMQGDVVAVSLPTAAVDIDILSDIDEWKIK
nr:nucleotidyltransferase family protein [uncultured Amphritea sp.]